MVEDWFMDLISTSPSETRFQDSLLSATASGDAAAILGTAQDSTAARAAATPATSAASMNTASSFHWDGTANSDEMQTLLALLPQHEAVGDELAGLGLDLGAVSASEPWTWNGASDVPVSV
jgi:hypothetical protein